MSSQSILGTTQPPQIGGILGQNAAPPITGVLATPSPKKMPSAGFLPGQLYLNDAIAPKVPEKSPRPFAPGEYVRNPDGGWSSEISVSVSHPQLNGGAPTNIPSLWLVNGKPYRAHNEDEAAELAVKSGLSWPTFKSFDDADAAATARENDWQKLKRPEDAVKVKPLWTVK